MTCTSATNCIAVGGSSARAFNALIERWNGTRWSIVTSPQASGSDYRLLSAVSCTSASNCTAVGAEYRYTPDVFETLVERWNGATWNTVASPNPPGANYSALAAISCTSATNCFAVGESNTSAPTTLIEHWSGTAWKLVASPTPHGHADLTAVSCTTTTDCMAVGNYLGTRPLAERYS
jgi:hypothetical protein